MRDGGATAPLLQQHQRAFNPNARAYRQPRAIDLGNARERGCNPRRSEVHPIPRRAINNIPILDTIHLEINRQPIGKPGQIDFEIDNLRSLARLLACPFVRSFVLSFYSSGLFSGKRQAAVTGVESIKMPSHSRLRLVTSRDTLILNHNAVNRYCDERTCYIKLLCITRFFKYLTSLRLNFRDTLLKCKSLLHVRERSFIFILSVMTRTFRQDVDTTHRQEGVVRVSTMCTDLMWCTRR